MVVLLSVGGSAAKCGWECCKMGGSAARWVGVLQDGYFAEKWVFLLQNGCFAAKCHEARGFTERGLKWTIFKCRQP